MKRKVSALLILMVGVSLVGIQAVFALATDISATIACTGWINGTGTVEWTRANTTTGVENLYYLAVDGAGNVILNVSDNRPVGSNAVLSPSYPWDSAPQFNPITLTLISPAGNGEPEQRHLVAFGDCAGLSTYRAPAGRPDLQVAGPPATNLYDGRINNSQTKDVAAPVAIYCTREDTIAIFRIDPVTSKGTRIINHPRGDEPAAENQLLASAEGVSLFLLSTGEYQVNAPNFEFNLYSITWEGCDPSTLVHLSPQP